MSIAWWLRPGINPTPRHDGRQAPITCPCLCHCRGILLSHGPACCDRVGVKAEP